MGFKKKLYALRPDREGLEVETQRTKLLRRREPADPRSIERGVRQLLADKVCGTLVGLWLLVPEHLRLGTWDLLCGWCRCPGQHLEPRLALQVVHEAALCTHGRRAQRSLSQRGFELANGLPFLASDPAIHDLLDAHTVAEAEGLQATLGQIRRARGHYRGSLLVIDPHRTRSYTKRHVRRYRAKGHARSYKMAQTFFCLDAHTGQPVAFTTATAARTVSVATPPLLTLAARILAPHPPRPLVLDDTEHYTAALLDFVHDLLDNEYCLLNHQLVHYFFLFILHDYGDFLDIEYLNNEFDNKFDNNEYCGSGGFSASAMGSVSLAVVL